MTGICKLCKETRSLQYGHIVPRFAVKWLKKTSATGYLKDLTSDRRRQETKREYVLCSACEQLLGRDEKQFSENIFIPYCARKARSFPYDRWLLRFVVGLHWRTLTCRTEQASAKVERSFDEACELWRQYLLGASPYPPQHESHIFFVDVIDQSTTNIPAKANWYLARAFDATPAFSEAGDTYAYTLLPKIVTFSFLAPRDSSKEDWRGTQIHDGGTITIPQEIRSSLFGNFIRSRMKLIEQAKKTMTPRQTQRLMEQVEKDPESLLSSESFQVFLADQRHRQSKILGDPSGLTKGRDRNKPCYCGSGRKYKKCCGSTKSDESVLLNGKG